jgi:hypothetical protein
MPVAPTQAKAAPVAAVARAAVVVTPSVAASFQSLFNALTPLQQALCSLYMEERENAYVASALTAFPPTELVALSRAVEQEAAPASTGKNVGDLWLRGSVGTWSVWNGSAWVACPPPVSGLFT